MLNKVIHEGPREATPLLIAHGLFGSARNWSVIAKRLSETRTVIAVDMRNHGQSPWHDSHAYEDMADDLARFKQPKQVILVKELPRNTMGKVQKNMLRETYADLFA